MKIINSIYLANFTAGVIATIISIIITFVIIGVLFNYVVKSKKHKKMVKNRKKPNDTPEKRS